MMSVVEFPTWRTKIYRNLQTGAIFPTSGNAMLFLQHDPVLRGMLAFDEMADRAVITKPPPIGCEGQQSRPGPYPRAWQAPDVELTLAYLQVECPRFSRETVRACMAASASANRFHPVCDWLRGLRWDGIERCSKWLQAAFDVPDSSYARAVGRAFLVAAVRRVRQPGCKFDYMLVMEGKQGLGKSTALYTLFGGGWFTDRLPRELDSPDAIRAMLGKWCVELAENDQIIRGGVETIKSFLSRSTDRIVPKYENEARDIPRQCVIVGTTNRDDYLRDATGNRRFWPVECRAADPAWLELNRDQLWAEACAIEASGGEVWLTDPDIRADAEAVQAERVAEDTWMDVLGGWLSGKPDVSMEEVLSDALGIPRMHHERKHQLRAGDCLRRLGWDKHNVGRGGSYGGKRWRQT